MTISTSARWAMLLVLCAPLAAGCGSVKEKLLPKASVLGVSVVGATPEHIIVRVDVKTDDVDLMLGMVKVKYKMTLLDSSQEQRNDNVRRGDLVDVRDSGFAFLVKIPLTKTEAETRLGYKIEGEVVFQVIAKIAEAEFSHKGEFTIKP
jgi:hypothetical protein